MARPRSKKSTNSYAGFGLAEKYTPALKKALAESGISAAKLKTQLVKAWLLKQGVQVQ